MERYSKSFTMCGFRNSATFKSQQIPIHGLFPRVELKNDSSRFSFSPSLLQFHIVCYKENKYQFSHNF